MLCVQATVPRDFDTEAYLTWHPSLLDEGVNDTTAARAHYAQHGSTAGFIYKPLRVVYMFEAEQGQGKRITTCVDSGYA